MLNRFVVVALESAAEFAERTPKDADVEYRFVELAVVEKKFVVVPAVRERLPRVVRPVTARVPMEDVLALRVVEVAVPK